MTLSSFEKYILVGVALAYVAGTIPLNPDGFTVTLPDGISVALLPFGSGDEGSRDNAPVQYPAAYLPSATGSVSHPTMWISAGGKNFRV